MVARELSITWTEAWLVVVVATGIYATMVSLSRLFGQRQFTSSSSYDLAFTFAIGSLMGRVVLVRTSLAVAALGLLTMFVLHAVVAVLHHRLPKLHRAMENQPILVVANGEVVGDGVRRARISRAELYQQLRGRGHGSLESVRAAIFEPDGTLSVISAGERLDPELVGEVSGRERLSR